jgi:hypothetical protein
MTVTETTMAAPARRPWLRAALVIVAAYELWDALGSVPNIFADYGHETALLRFVQGLISVQLALDPLIAAAALVFAVMSRLRQAVIALAVLALLGWMLDDLWSIPIHGLELDLTLGGLLVVAKIFIFPAAAIIAIVLARKDRRLGLAVLLVSLPTLVKWIGIALFAIAMSMYGF